MARVCTFTSYISEYYLLWLDMLAKRGEELNLGEVRSDSSDDAGVLNSKDGGIEHEDQLSGKYISIQV